MFIWGMALPTTPKATLQQNVTAMTGADIFKAST
jgi:hypothetical protein